MQRQRLRCSDDLRKVVCWPLTSRQVVHTIPNSHSPYYRKLVNLILFNGGWKGGGIQQEWGQGVRSASPCGISRLWLPGSGSAAPGQRPRSREKWPHDSPQCPVHSSQQTPANRQAVATGPPGRTMAAPGLGPQWSELPRRSPGALLPKATALISSWLLGEEKAELEIVQPTSFETHLSFLTSPFRLTSAQGCARFHPPPSPFGPQPTRTSAPRFPVPNGSDVSVPNSSRAARICAAFWELESSRWRLSARPAVSAQQTASWVAWGFRAASLLSFRAMEKATLKPCGMVFLKLLLCTKIPFVHSFTHSFIHTLSALINFGEMKIIKTLGLPWGGGGKKVRKTEALTTNHDAFR